MKLTLRGKIGIPGCAIGKLVLNKDLENKYGFIQSLSTGNISCFTKGYAAYLFENYEIPNSIIRYLKSNNIPFLYDVKDINNLEDHDIVKISSDIGLAHILYRYNSDDNSIYVTNKCNSNCIFCPDSQNIRKRQNAISVEFINRIIDLLPIEIKYLGITGGEPTILKNILLGILKRLKGRLINTQFYLISNGRMFFYENFAKEYIEARPKNLITAIAIHAQNSAIHDYCSNIKGSFIQTFIGIKNLYVLGERIELRIVINKNNYMFLSNISNMIVQYFPNVFRVNFMALEMLGNAFINRNNVWVDFDVIKKYLEDAILILIKSGINAQIYNFPLCFIDEQFWQVTKPSIIDYKVRYLDECNICKVKQYCGGFFESTIKVGKIKVKPIN